MGKIIVCAFVLLTLVLVFAGIMPATAQPPAPVEEWNKTFGGVSHEWAYSGQQTSDEGYVIAGVTYPYGADSWSSDVYLVKTDENGNEAWSKTFGGSSDDRGRSVQQTSDGGYIIVGLTFSYGAGHYDAYLIKTDSEGNKHWSKTFGGFSEDVGYSVQQTSDGGYIIVGTTFSYAAGFTDVYLIKTDENGDETWSKTFGGLDYDSGRSVQQTSDGGYIITGDTSSYGAGNDDVWLIKTDSEGNKQWSRTFGGLDYDSGRSVQQTSDGGYIITGDTSSYGAGNDDVWLIKTDSEGNKQWSRTFGGFSGDYGRSVQQTSDGGYILVGITKSYGAGNDDVWLIKTDSEGSKQWSETYGGLNHDFGRSVQQTSDGGYIITGDTSSYGAFIDVWLIKIAPETEPTIPTLKCPLAGNIESRKILLGFGDLWTWTYCGGLPKKHAGVDLKASVGEDVYAAYDGKIVKIYDLSSVHNWGKGVIIEHTGFTTSYMHVNPVVKEEDYVNKGQKISTIANIDGDEHLHFGVRSSTYSGISKRGALPQKHGDSDYQDGRFTGCKSDPLFPEKFVDPMKLKYETTPQPAKVFCSHNIISDHEFTNANAMTQQEIQKFLESKGSCLATYKVDGKSAAQIIYEECQAKKISPKVMLATIQRETSLVGPYRGCNDIWKGSDTYADRAFMCDRYNPNTKGFDNQSRCAANTFRKWYDAGEVCKEMKVDDGTVIPLNRATYALYKYDTEISGNKLFYKVYTGWGWDPKGGSYAPGTPVEGCCEYCDGKCYDGNRDPEECRVCYGGTWYPGWHCEEGECIPEFTTIAIPVAAIIGLMFLFSRRKRKKEEV